jgi:GNAT superfamily N-acetyltransferase
MEFSYGRHILKNEEKQAVGEIEISDPQSEFGPKAPFYFGEWIAIADLEIYPEFRRLGYARKTMEDLIRWAELTGKSGIILRPMPDRRSGIKKDELKSFYREFGFRDCDTSPGLMEKKFFKPMAFNLFAALKRLGFHKEAAELKELIPDSIKEDPLTTAFAFGNLNIGAFVESDDDIEVDFDFIDRVLNKAELYGFGGDCGAAAVAINRVLFDGKGSLVAFVNKHLYDTEDRMVGHVVVKWMDSYWDSEGEKSRIEMESFGSLDRYDSDYSFPKDADETEVEEISLSEEDVLDIFEGCNLNSMIEMLSSAKEEVQGEL